MKYTLLLIAVVSALNCDQGSTISGSSCAGLGFAATDTMEKDKACGTGFDTCYTQTIKAGDGNCESITSSCFPKDACATAKTAAETSNAALVAAGATFTASCTTTAADDPKKDDTKKDDTKKDASTNALKCIEMEAQAILSCKGEECPDTDHAGHDHGRFLEGHEGDDHKDDHKEPHLEECKAADGQVCLTYSVTIDMYNKDANGHETTAVAKVKKSECGFDMYNCAGIKKKDGTTETDEDGKNMTYRTFECTETTVNATAADLKAADAAHDSFQKDEEAKFSAAGQVVPSAIAFMFAAVVSMLM